MSRVTNYNSCLLCSFIPEVRPRFITRDLVWSSTLIFIHNFKIFLSFVTLDCFEISIECNEITLKLDTRRINSQCASIKQENMKMDYEIAKLRNRENVILSRKHGCLEIKTGSKLIHVLVIEQRRIFIVYLF